MLVCGARFHVVRRPMPPAEQIARDSVPDWIAEPGQATVREAAEGEG